MLAQTMLLPFITVARKSLRIKYLLLIAIALSLVIIVAQGRADSCANILENLKGLLAAQAASPVNEMRAGDIVIQIRHADFLTRGIGDKLPPLISGTLNIPKAELSKATISLGHLKYELTPDDLAVDLAPEYSRDSKIQTFLRENNLQGVFATLHLRLKKLEVMGSEISLNLPKFAGSVDQLAVATQAPIAITIPVFVSFSPERKTPRVQIISLENLTEVLNNLHFKWEGLKLPEGTLDIDLLSSEETLKRAVLSTLAEGNEIQIITKINEALEDVLAAAVPQGIAFSVKDIPIAINAVHASQSDGTGLTVRLQGSSGKDIIAATKVNKKLTKLTKLDYDMAVAARPELLQGILDLLFEKGVLTNLPADKEKRDVTVSFRSAPRIELFPGKTGDSISAKLYLDIQLSDGLIKAHHIPVKSGFSTQATVKLELTRHESGTKIIPRIVGIEAESIQFDFNQVSGLGGIILRKSKAVQETTKNIIAGKINNLIKAEADPLPFNLEIPAVAAELFRVTGLTYDEGGHLLVLFKNATP